MDMGHDFEDPRGGAGMGLRIGRFAAPSGLRRDEPATLRPDWAALRSRFEAIHALRRTLATGVAPHLPAGGFADSGRAVLSSCRQEVSSVNLVYSANGKADWAITNPVAAPPPSGDRGIQ